MQVLIDTHAFLWYTAGKSRLSESARNLMDDKSVSRFVSAASLWEIAIKYSRGRLGLTIPLPELFEEIEASGWGFLGIERRHLLQLPSLDQIHGGPFDRLLVAQAKAEGLALVSNDRTLDGYGIQRLW